MIALRSRLMSAVTPGVTLIFLYKLAPRAKCLILMARLERFELLTIYPEQSRSESKFRFDGSKLAPGLPVP